MSRLTESAAYQRGIRAAITWLHEEARRQMNDPHARSILNNAGFHLGVAKLVEARSEPAVEKSLGTTQDPIPPSHGEGM